MITKSDLYAIAGVLKHLKPCDKPMFFEYSTDSNYYDAFGAYNQWESTVKSFAGMLGANNPKFKRSIFYKACDYQPEEVENANTGI